MLSICFHEFIIKEIIGEGNSLFCLVFVAYGKYPVGLKQKECASVKRKNSSKNGDLKLEFYVK